MGKGAKGKQRKSDKKLDKKAARKASSKAAAKEVEQQARQDEAIAEHEAEAVQEIKDVANTLRVGKGFVLADVDTSATPGFTGDKIAGKAALEGVRGRAVRPAGAALRRVHGRLEAVGPARRAGHGHLGQGRHHAPRRRPVNPQGVKATAFKAPTKEERAHDFLWRIEKALPEPGQLGRLRPLALRGRAHRAGPRARPAATWSERYAQINAFERKVIAAGTTVVKVMTHISQDEQKARLDGAARPARTSTASTTRATSTSGVTGPTYMEAYQTVARQDVDAGAPWHVVPADRKWYARLAVQQPAARGPAGA